MATCRSSARRASSTAPQGGPLQKELWSGAVDSVGSTTLANVLAQTAYGGAVAACGLAGGMDLPASVAPHILRAVALLGIDSVTSAIGHGKRSRTTSTRRISAASPAPSRCRLPEPRRRRFDGGDPGPCSDRLHPLSGASLARAPHPVYLPSRGECKAELLLRKQRTLGRDGAPPRLARPRSERGSKLTTGSHSAK